MTITSPRRMSSDDIRYARRSDVGAADPSTERFGKLATVESFEFMVALTQNK